MSVEGVDELMAVFEKLENCEGMKQAVGRACMLVQGDAIEKAPKDTGRLKGSIQFDVNESESEIEGIVYTNLEYGAFQEFGTGKHAEKGGRKTPWLFEDDDGETWVTWGNEPHPFMRPALKENRNKIEEILREGLLK